VSTGAIAATYRHPRADDYTRPGGAWDAPPLDTLLTVALGSATGAAGTSATLVVDGDRRVTGADLVAQTAALAGGLRALGVRPGDTVVWQLPNRVEAVLLYRACWRLGAIAAPLHHLAGPQETRRMADALAPRAVFALGGSPLLEWLGAIEVASPAWDRCLGAEPVTHPWPDGSELAAVLHTSGSSGTPKAVLHSQHTLAYKAAQMAPVHGLGAGDCVLMPAPLAHVSGLLNGVTLPGATPFATVLMARWDAELALELVEREQVTFMIGPPTFFVSMMHAPAFSTERVASLRLVSSGGAGVTEAFVEEASERLGCTVKRTYGSTEAPTIATSTPEDPRDAARRHDGRAIGAVELRVDPANGELLVQGPEVCCGYLDARHTAGAFSPDGWFRTGDRATLDGGWLTITGRLKDVVIRGGENISTGEVEQALEAHPAVRHAVVVGYPDDVMGERVCAYVESAATFDVDACRQWFAERGVARYKTPEQVVVVDALPLLPTGKPDRATLRADARARFGVRPSTG
jgi:cyclohexanecarboxylate-CoA ligase